MEILTIGRVASRAGIGVETVRFYERQELVDSPPRSVAGYRQYPENTIQRLRFIRRAKELGFSLKEIKELLLFCTVIRSLLAVISDNGRKKSWMTSMGGSII